MASPQGEGGSQFSWNGREENGSPAPNGVYKYTIKAVDGAKEEASASGQIGLNRSLPGTVTKPTPEATITGTSRFVFTPTRAKPSTPCPSTDAARRTHIRACWARRSFPNSTAPLPSKAKLADCPPAQVEMITYVTWTDPFGQEHFYAAPVVPVTVAYPEQISSLSNRYFNPNGSGQEETA